VVGCREGKFRIVHAKPTRLQVEKTAGTAEVVQDMAIDMEKDRVVTEIGDDVRVPNLFEERPGFSSHDAFPDLCRARATVFTRPTDPSPQCAAAGRSRRQAATATIGWAGI
jgi:hypothetical protein